MEIDKESGYLIPRKIEGLKSFDVQAKQTFLKLYETEGSIANVCDTLGISSRTFYDHLKEDSAFRADYALTLRRMASQLEGTMFKKSTQNNGYMYMITWLRKNFPTEWNPKTSVTVTNSTESVDALFSALEADGKLINVTDSVGPLPTQGNDNAA